MGTNFTSSENGALTVTNAKSQKGLPPCQRHHPTGSVPSHNSFPYQQYTYTYKYIPTHVTMREIFWGLKGDKNLRCQLSNDWFQNSNDQFLEGSETHLPYSLTQMTNFQGDLRLISHIPRLK